MRLHPSIRLRSFLALLSLILFSSVGLAQGEDPGRVAGFRPRVYAFVNARLVLAPGREVPRGTLVVRDGLISQAGARVAIPTDAVRIDATGLVAYPGFIDSDADDLLTTSPALPRSEGRVVDFSRYVLAATRPDNRKSLTPQFSVTTALKLDRSKLDGIRRHGFTSVHVVPSGRISSGDAALVSTAGAPPRESVIHSHTFSAFELRPPGGTGYPRTLMGAHAHLRQAFLDARRFAHQRNLYGKATPDIPRPPADPVLEALVHVLDETRRVAFRVTTRDDIHRALRFCREQGVKPVLLGADEAHRCLDDLSSSQTDLLLSLRFGSEPKSPSSPDGDTLRATVPLPRRVQRDRRRRWRERLATAGQLHRSGLRLGLGSRGLKDRGTLLSSIRQAISSGLPVRAALAALTIDAASLLGVGDRLGTLAPGRLGHLALWTGRFEQSTSQVRYVLVDGVLFEYNRRSTPAVRTPANPLNSGPPPAPPLPRTTAPRARPAVPSELHADRLSRSHRTGGNVLIRNATVLTGRGQTLRQHSILIRDGKIVRVAPDLKADPGMVILDASGQFVMPGIIDTHSHIKITQGINESSQSIVPEVRVRDVVNTADIAEFRALAGGVTTARLLHGSANVVGGQDAVVKLKYGGKASEQILADAPQGVKFALGENVKFRTARFPNTRMGVEATLNRAFLEAIDYRRRWQQYEKSRAARKSSVDSKPLLAPRRDLRLEALADIVNHRKFIHSHCYRADEILMLLRVASNLGIRVWSLQHVLEGYKIAPEIAAHGASCSTFSDWWAYKVEAYDAIPHNAALLSEAGAEVVIKSDDAELIRHLYQEAAKPVRYGNMPVEKALATITFNAARQLGLHDRIGSIEEGKDADLALFNAHPLNSFARCETTLIEGEIYFSRQTHPTAMSPASRQRTATPPSLTLPSADQRTRSLKLADDDSSEYALVGGTLHPVTSPPVRGTLLIKQGKIVALGDDVKLPASTRVIDVTGLQIYPGLIDAGTTLGLTEIKKVKETSDHAEGGGLQPDLRAGVAINPDSELFPVARAGGITTALVHASGGLIAGQSSLVRLAGWTAPEMVVDYEAALKINWPARGNDKQRQQQVDAIRALLTQARVYQKLVATAKTAGRPGPIGDPRLDALAPYIARQRPVFIEAHSRQQIAEAMLFAEKEKLKLVITGGTNAWKLATHLKTRGIPVIVGPVMRKPLNEWDPSDAPYANPGLLHEAGVKFCIRSDDAPNSRNAPFEAAMAVAHGLPEDVALKSVTIAAAEILGVSDQLGSLEMGKTANLVILDGSPLQVTSQVKGVFVDGRPFQPESRQTRFYDRYRQRLQTRPK